ncbi:MAG: hypothetical protein WAV51_01225 [Microgenomates group bacterium]
MDYEMKQVYKGFFVGMAILFFAMFFVGCAKQEIPLPADAQNVVETNNMIVYTTSDNQEHVICKNQSDIIFSKEAVMLDSPSCDDEKGELQISTTDGLLKLSVVFLTDTPSANHVSVSYHFRLQEKDDLNERFFENCVVQIGANDSVPMIGLSAFSFVVEEDATVSILCSLDDFTVKAEFPVISEKVE